MISVVFSTYQRGHLMERSLHCYAHSRLNVPLEIIVIDDGSTDNTQQICDQWSSQLDIKYIKLYKQLGKWRDCSTTINMGIRAAKGSLVIPTHPEVMPGIDSLQTLWDLRRERAYLACKIYYLSIQNQLDIDTVPWRDQGAGAVRLLPDFYNTPSAELSGQSDYAHAAMERHTSWGSWVFGGFTKETWRWFGGLTEFEVWGSVDVDFLNRRNILQIPTLTPMGLDTICVHQNHDIVRTETDVLTPRIMEQTMAALPAYINADMARKNYI